MNIKKGKRCIPRKAGYIADGKDVEGLAGRVEHPFSEQARRTEIQKFGFFPSESD